MSVPGAFTRDFSDDDLDESYHLPTGTRSRPGAVSSSQAEADQDDIDSFLDEVDEDDDSEGDLDFLPEEDVWGANLDEDDDEEEDEVESPIQVEAEEDEDEQEEEEQVAGGPRQLQIGFDRECIFLLEL